MRHEYSARGQINGTGKVEDLIQRRGRARGPEKGVGVFQKQGYCTARPKSAVTQEGREKLWAALGSEIVS
jgi:hypothetical protein